MKKIFLFLTAAIIIAACGNGGNNENGTNDSALNNDEASAPVDVTTTPDYQNGLALIAKSDCLTCHKVDEKLIGPAYKDVAKKYAGSDTAVSYLAGKVITGGSGVWGEIAMTPHPTLSQQDAEQMVKYILLLNQTQ